MKILYSIIGSVLASFINVEVIRSRKKEDFIFSRSHCPNCGHVLSFTDMIPVLSYLLLQGKCRYCNNRISKRYLHVELLGILIGVLSSSYQEMLAGMILLAISLYDWDNMIIKDRYLLLLVLISLFMIRKEYVGEHLIGALTVSLPLGLMAVITKGFGYGDVKLMAVSGFLLGWERVLLAFMLGCVSAGIYGLYLIVVRKASFRTQIPFGPFLSLGIYVSLLYGYRLIDLYLHT